MTNHAPNKEGLQSAVDFTKFLLTLAGGGIAFVIQPTQFEGSGSIKAFSFAALVLLTISAISGLVVFSGSSVNLADGKYQLDDPWIKIPGIINVVSFGFGFVALAVAVAIRILSA
jgi:hypothetical protein